LYTVIKAAGQIALLCGISLASGILASFFHLPLSGNILGIIILYFLLQCNIVSMDWVELGANILLAEFLLFFIPSAVGVIQYRNLLLTNGPYILLVIVLSTIIVMAITGLSAKKIEHIQEGQ